MLKPGALHQLFSIGTLISYVEIQILYELVERTIILTF